MKRPFLAAIALLTLALPVAAQQRMSGPPQSGTGIFTGITLTPAQQKQVDSIYASNQPMRDKMKAHSMTPSQSHSDESFDLVVLQFHGLLLPFC